MGELALATVVFLALHVLPATPARDWLIARLGDPAYMGLFSLVSVLGLAWMVVAYGSAPAGELLWITGPAVRWVTALLMLFPFILLVFGTTTPNPTSVRGKKALRSDRDWGGVFAITRHPVMWAIAIWALLHLLNRPDLRSLLFFGALGLLAVAGSHMQETRKRAESGAAWDKFAAQTSHAPFAGVFSGRAKLRLRDFDGWRLASAAGLWIAVLFVHGPLFGIYPVPL